MSTGIQPLSERFPFWRKSLGPEDEVEPPTPAYFPPHTPPRQYTQPDRHPEIPKSESRTPDSTTFRIVEPPAPAYFPPTRPRHRHPEVPLPSSSRQQEHTLPHGHSETCCCFDSVEEAWRCAEVTTVVGMGGCVATSITLVACCCAGGIPCCCWWC